MSSQSVDWNQLIVDEFRANGGNVATQGFGRTLVLLHHTGAKSGIERVYPVISVRDDKNTWLIVASKAGAPDNPDWYYNLLAHPDTEIEVPGEGTVPVRVEELKGNDRDEAWSRFTATNPGFRQYEQNAPRVIPVLALNRR